MRSTRKERRMRSERRERIDETPPSASSPSSMRLTVTMKKSNQLKLRSRVGAGVS